jgi:actin
MVLNCPIDQGIVTNWEDMELIWHEVFYNELRVDPAENPVLLTEAPLNPKANRERTIQLLFETFRVPSLYLAIGPVLALYSAGRETGIVLEAGDSATHAVPAYEGHSFPHAIRVLNLGGRDLTVWWEKVLNERGFTFPAPEVSDPRFRKAAAKTRKLVNARGQNLVASEGREIARDMKEKLGYLALDFDAEMNQAAGSQLEIPYALPDGRAVVLGSERFRCPEMLFQPRLSGFGFDGVHRSVVDSIEACDADVRKDLYGNIVLSGGPRGSMDLRRVLRRKSGDSHPLHVRRRSRSQRWLHRSGNRVPGSVDQSSHPSVYSSKC